MNIPDAQIENGRMVLGDQRTVETDIPYGLAKALLARAFLEMEFFIGSKKCFASG